MSVGWQSLPVILAVCAFTGLVGYNCVLVCKNCPDGGGVYSAARSQSRFLAVMGALLIVAMVLPRWLKVLRRPAAAMPRPA